MASTPCPMLEDYNSLLDPNLAQYFSSPIIKRHLRKIGLINRKGELRSETEIVQFNAEIKQKSQFNDLLSRAIILKAAELDRQRQHEMKKLQNEFEKKERVKKARDGKNKMDYTKILSAKFYTEGEDEDYIEIDDHEEEVTLTLPIAIPMPEGDQVYSMSKLMQQKKVMSPYIADGRPNTVGHHALPTLVHDRVQARIYGSGKKYQKRPTSNQSRASFTMGPKKSVTISSINRLARSKLPALEKQPPRKGKKKSKKSQQAVKTPESVDSGHESVKAESVKADSEKAELIEELIQAENIEPVREVRSSTPTKSSSKSSRKNSSSSKKSKGSSKSSSRDSSRNSIKEDVQVRVESPSVKASSEHEKSLSSSSNSSSRVSSAQSHHHKKSSSEKSSLSKRPVLPSLSRGHSSSSSRSSKSLVSSHGSENALPETVMHSRISRISNVHDESIVTVDVSSESDSGEVSSIKAVDISSCSSQVALPTEITSSVSKHPSTWDLPKSAIEVQPDISECVSITTKPNSEVISLKSSTPNENQEFQVKIQPVHNNRPISGQSTKSTISVKSTVSSDLGFEAELLKEVIAEVEKSNNSRMNSRTNTESVMKNEGTSPSVNAVVENESLERAFVRSLVASVESLNSSISEDPENAEIVDSFMDKSVAKSEEAVSDTAVSEIAVSEKGVSEKAISEKFNSSINFNDEVSEVASEKSISRSDSYTIVEDDRYYEDAAESLCSSRSSEVDLPVSILEKSIMSKSMMSKSRQSLISIPASRMSLVSGVTKASYAMIPDSASSSENEEEMMPARSTTETKASAYSLPMTPQTLKKENSNSLSSSMSSLTSSSSSDSKSRSKSKASAMFA